MYLGLPPTNLTVMHGVKSIGEDLSPLLLIKSGYRVTSLMCMRSGVFLKFTCIL